jgi:hypothetical protein
MIEDDGGFARTEGRSHDWTPPYFECKVREEACEDMPVAAVKLCGCAECKGYLEFVADEEQADETWDGDG